MPLPREEKTMLFTFAMIFLLGMAAGDLCRRVHLPPLMGMLLTGILIGPHCLNRMDASVLDISAQLRQIALIVILLRAGLNLKPEDLRRVGRPAILMCFVPATLEILGMVLLAPLFFPLSRMEALLLGTVIAAVSPAVIVPHMLGIMEQGWGTRQGIPQMILAGASADDVFVIVLFTSCTGMVQTGSFAAWDLLRIPTSILLGILAGILAGMALGALLERTALAGTQALLVILSAAFGLVSAEGALTGPVGFSGLIAAMVLGMTLSRKAGVKAQEASAGLSRIWTAAQVLLFVLVGAAVDIRYAAQAGGRAVALILLVLVFRMLGVMLCLLGTALDRRERLFAMLAYTPKATVQAAIGAIPLTMGLSCGNTVLTVAVVSILLTAPLGAFLIELTYTRFLKQ